MKKQNIQIATKETEFIIKSFPIKKMPDLDSFMGLYNIVLVLPNIEMNPPQVYMCSPS